MNRDRYVMNLSCFLQILCDRDAVANYAFMHGDVRYIAGDLRNTLEDGSSVNVKAYSHVSLRYCCLAPRCKAAIVFFDEQRYQQWKANLAAFMCTYVVLSLAA